MVQGSDIKTNCVHFWSTCVGKEYKIQSIPDNKKLSTIYKYITGNDLVGAHSAAVDVSALLLILLYKPVWVKHFLEIESIVLEDETTAISIVVKEEEE